MSIKVIKPLRLSILYRPYRWQAENQLCVTVMALVDLSQPQPRLLSDIELWRDCVPQMDCEGVLDLVLPKVVPEYLIAGNAYTHHQDDKTKVAVKAQVGGLEKELLVFGDRYWLDERNASEPESFEQLPVSWATTFGGPSFALNPLGKGMEASSVAASDGFIPLPNVEGLTDRTSHRTQEAKAVGFGPLSVLWPQRYQHLGSYSEEWKKHEFPGFFPDLNPLMFNAASPDQHWAEREQIPLGQSFAFWNMHPEKPCWEGKLPEWQIRCFAELNSTEGTQIQEMAMRATTAWFLPHQEQAVLIFHGTLAVSEHDASDVRKLMPALEHAGMQPLAESYYHDIMRQRSDPQKGGLYVDADEQLIPLALQGPLNIDMPDVFSSATWVKARNRMQQLQAELAAELAGGGLNPDEYPLEIVGPPRRDSDMDFSDSSWQPKSIEQEQQDLLAQLDEEHIAEVNASSLSAEEKERWLASKPSLFLHEAATNPESDEKGPPQSLLLQIQSAQAMQDDLKAGRVGVEHLDKLNPGWALDAEHRRKVAEGGLPAGEDELQVDAPFELMQDPDFLMQMERLDVLQRQMYLLAVQTQLPVDRLDEAQSQSLRLELLRLHENGQSLHNLDLTGAVLSGLHLADADLTGAWLEGADLKHTLFERCVFDSAVLARTDLHQARFINCSFDQTNLSLAMLLNTTFNHCRFRQTVFEDASFKESMFAECEFSEMSLQKLNIEACIWEGGRFSLSLFDEITVSGSQFQAIAFDKVSFQSTRFSDTRFMEATLEGCGFFISRFEQVLFQASVLKNSAIHYQSEVHNMVFNDCDLSQCFFREMDLGSVVFDTSRLGMCDFTLCSLIGTSFKSVDAEKANFSGAMLHTADFSQAHLIDADFTAADMRFANFTRANLFRANFALAQIDASTLLQGAYIEEANVYPMRKDKVQ